MALRGNPARLKDFSRSLSQLSTTLAQNVARDAGPVLTQLAGQAYDQGRTVYGESRPLGVNGNALTLERTGATRRDTRFTSVGTVVRCTLSTKWAKYLIGKYSILPNGSLPRDWSRKLTDVAREHFNRGVTS